MTSPGPLHALLEEKSRQLAKMPQSCPDCDGRAVRLTLLTYRKELATFLSNYFPDFFFFFHLKLTQNTVRKSMTDDGAIKNNSEISAAK